jgi:uncharacterized protein (TIGR00369 family)
MISEGTDTFAGLPLLAFLAVRPVPPLNAATYSMRMDLTPKAMNLMGAAHGGAVATLIDAAGGIAAGQLVQRPGPTADLMIRYLAPATGPWIRADATIVKAGRRLVIVDVKVTAEDGRLVAVGSLSVAPLLSPGKVPPDG